MRQTQMTYLILCVENPGYSGLVLQEVLARVLRVQGELVATEQIADAGSREH